MSSESTVVPNLCTYSGQSSEEVESYLREAESKQSASINRNNSANNYRGYSLIGATGDVPVREITKVPSAKRPIWFLYMGTGSHWPSCAKDMMIFGAFRDGINRCADVLRPKGIDVIKLLTDSDESMLENIQNVFIMITAVHVALTDLLHHIGITPDGIYGVSLGEFGCAYADGCFTTEQIMLAAYWRGQSILDSDLVPSESAAIGLSREEASKRLPEDVFIIANNNEKAVCICGKADPVTKFVEKLKAEGISTYIFKTLGVPFHTKFIAEAATKLSKNLNEVIPEPRKRSSRWLSSSIPPSEWNSPIAEYSSADYHVNNFKSPMQFLETIQYIPKNAICIEIGPTGMNQRHIGGSLGAEITFLSLMRRNHSDNRSFFLTAIGKLNNAGAEPDISKLYD